MRLKSQSRRGGDPPRSIHLDPSSIRADRVLGLNVCRFGSSPFRPPAVGVPVLCFCVSYDGPMVPRSCRKHRNIRSPPKQLCVKLKCSLEKIKEVLLWESVLSRKYLIQQTKLGELLLQVFTAGVGMLLHQENVSFFALRTPKNSKKAAAATTFSYFDPSSETQTEAERLAGGNVSLPSSSRCCWATWASPVAAESSCTPRTYRWREWCPEERREDPRGPGLTDTFNPQTKSFLFKCPWKFIEN